MDTHSTINLHTGRPMPIIGLGTWKLDDAASATESALTLGYPMIDTSGDYGTQPGIAEGLERSGIPREDIFIVTKVEEDEDAYESAKRNVGELGIENADLILIHRPPEEGVGEKLWEGLIRAREDGITRDIGVSNYSTAQLGALIEASGEMPAVNQIEWSPFGFSEDMLAYCADRGIVIQAYSPLTRHEKLDDPKLGSIARAYGKSPAQIVLRWHLERGTVPLPKAGRPEHQRENIEIFDFSLSARDIETLNTLNAHYSALGDRLQYV